LEIALYVNPKSHIENRVTFDEFTISSLMALRVPLCYNAA
jgi:hypothetical protein